MIVNNVYIIILLIIFDFNWLYCLIIKNALKIIIIFIAFLGYIVLIIINFNNFNNFFNLIYFIYIYLIN